MKKILLQIWRYLPLWVQRIASAILRPCFQVGIGAMIFNDQGQLLLCEHTYRRLQPWGLPGGDLKFGEDPVDGIRRETLEETGLSIQAAHLLLVENSKKTHHLSLTYFCTGVSGSFVPNEEVACIRYFDTDQFPEIFPENQITIQKCLAILNSEK